MLYKDFSEIGELIKREAQMGESSITTCLFDNVLIRHLKPKDKYQYIIEMPLDGKKPIGNLETINQKTLRDKGITKTIAGSGVKFLLGDIMINTQKNLVTNERGGVLWFKKELETKGLYSLINEELRASYMLEKEHELTQDDQSYFKGLIDSVDISRAEKALEEVGIQYKDNIRETFAYATIDNVILTQTKFYKYYAVWKFLCPQVNKLKNGICRLCGHERNVSVEYFKKLEELKFFTSTDAQYARNLTDFSESCPICSNCFQNLLFFERKIPQLFQPKRKSAEVMAYPTFFSFDIDYEDYKDIAKKTNDMVALLESESNIYEIEEIIEDINSFDDRGNQYWINILLYTSNNAARKINGFIENVDPLRIKEVFEKGNRYTKSAFSFTERHQANLPDKFSVGFKDFRFLFSNKKEKNKSWAEYINLMQITLQNGTYSREKISSLMSEKLYEKRKEKQKEGKEICLSPFKYALMLEYLESLNVLKKREGDEQLMYNILKERTKDCKETDNACIVLDYLDTFGIKDDEIISMIIIGFLAEQLNYHQSVEGNRGILSKVNTKRFTGADILDLVGELNDKMRIYKKEELDYNGLLFLLLNTYWGFHHDEPLKTSPEEVLIWFFAGVSLNKSTVRTRTSKRKDANSKLK